MIPVLLIIFVCYRLTHKLDDLAVRVWYLEHPDAHVYEDKDIWNENS
jgi:hypothetical protein